MCAIPTIPAVFAGTCHIRSVDLRKIFQHRRCCGRIGNQPFAQSRRIFRDMPEHVLWGAGTARHQRRQRNRGDGGSTSGFGRGLGWYGGGSRRVRYAWRCVRFRACRRVARCALRLSPGLRFQGFRTARGLCRSCPIGAGLPCYVRALCSSGAHVLCVCRAPCACYAPRTYSASLRSLRSS